MNFKQFLTEQTEQSTKQYYPHGVYVAVVPDEETKKTISDFQAKHLRGVDVYDKLHSTVIYSAKPRVDKIETSNATHQAEFDGYELFGEDKDILVMKIKSDSLNKRNDFLTKKYDLISDFDSYLAHITLAYDAKGFDLSSLPEFSYPIMLENEYTEDIDEEA